jgi:hypothetical protein
MVASQYNLNYFVDLFFLETPIYKLSGELFYRAVNTGLRQVGLKIDDVVSQQEFANNTQSVPVNRYIRIPKRFLSKYDERTDRPNTLDIIKFDPKAKKKEVEACKIEENITLPNEYFHNSRYMSGIALPIKIKDQEYTIIKVNYNYKLARIKPTIQDITVFTGLVLSRSLHCGGVFARAASFARSEELMLYAFNGDIKTKEVGNDTVMGHVSPAKITETYGIDILSVIDYIEEQITIHYAPIDISKIDSKRKEYFKVIGIDKPYIYSRLNEIMNKWWSQPEEQRKPDQILNVVTQMLKKESNIEKYTEIKNEEGTKGNALTDVALSVTELLIDGKIIKESINKDSYLNDYYWNVDFA